jgi:hypothetical protein
MDEVRKKLQSLQGTLDEEGDARDRFSRQQTLLSINARLGDEPTSGLMSSLGYSTGITGNAGVLSRIKQMKDSRVGVSMAEDPLDAAKSHTEKLQTRLVSEEEARQFSAMEAAQLSMQTARRSVVQRAEAREAAKVFEFEGKRRQRQEHLEAINRAGSEAITSIVDKERLRASQEARARRTDARSKASEVDNADPVSRVRSAIQANPNDELLRKLDQNIVRLASDVKSAEQNYGAAVTQMNVPGNSINTPDYWAGRLEDSSAQLAWMLRQATRRVQELSS